MPTPLQIPGELIARLRKDRQWTAAHLADLVGTTQQTINKIEMGNIGYSKYLAGIKEALNITDEMVAHYRQTTRDRLGAFAALPPLEANPTLPLHVTVGRISHGIYRLEICPAYKIQRPSMCEGVNDAYGMLMPDDSMAPEFRAGDTLAVNPSAPPEIGASHVFRAENGDCQVRRLIRISTDVYLVEPLANNGDETVNQLPKITWTPHLIVTRYRYMPATRTSVNTP